MPIYALPAATNLLRNPDFEQPRATFAFWDFLSGTGTYAVTSVIAWSGTNSYQFTVTIAGSPHGFSTTPTAGSVHRVLVTPGLPYSGMFHIRGMPGTTNKSASMSFTFRKSDGTNLGDFYSKDYPLDETGWTEVKFENIIAPALSEYVEIRLYGNHYAAIGRNAMIVGDKFVVDGADFRQAESIDSFVAGNQGTLYYWFGTAHQSMSGRYAKVTTVHVGRGGLIKITPELFKANKLNVLGEDITDVIKNGSVEMRTDRPIKMLFKGQLTLPEEINPYTDYFAPYMTVEYLDSDTVIREQVGLYSTAPMKETLTYTRRTAQLEGADLCWNLQDATFSGYYSIKAGKNIVDVIVSILASEGFTRHSITPSTLTQPLNRTWKADASKLIIINDLLESIGYYSIHADRYGVFTSFPYLDLLITEPAAVYYSGQGSTVIGALQKEPLTENIINWVKIISEDQSNPANSFVYELKNQNALSPVSIQNLGRTRFKAITDSNIVNVTIAAAKAKQIIQDAASLYTKYTMTTLPDPSRNVWEVYDANLLQVNNNPALVGRLRVSGWDIGFTPSTSKMSHYLNRVEQI